MRILVAEDDLTIRQMMATFLARKGFACTAVDNGRTAVEAWDEGIYDVILMDVQMPVMDGYQATRAIREKEAKRGGHVPIIAMTAYAYLTDRERCLNEGMDDYLSKPIDFGQLVALVSRYAGNA